MSPAPRVVLVTRLSDYEALLARHGTREQARFFVEQRGGSIDPIEERHRRLAAALAQVAAAIPSSWRRGRVDRQDLAQFVFDPHDLVVAVGQDGLVANVAKYLHGQPVLGINPDRETYDGVLVSHEAKQTGPLLQAAAAGRVEVQERTMVEARLDDGQRLLALNEIFVGHESHQSARYLLGCGEQRERQSSSGLIVATGTGATGWARSINGQAKAPLRLPHPEESALAFFVREPFPSRATGTAMVGGRLDAATPLSVVSEMDSGGVIFGDGIERDRIPLPWGVRLRLGVAPERLRLIGG